MWRLFGRLTQVAAQVAALAGSLLVLMAWPAQADLPVSIAHPGYPHDRSDLQVDPDTRYGILPNGMRYVLYRNRTKARAAAIRFQIAAGSMQENDAQRGLAHFVEHMAFNGSKNIAEGEFTKLLARNAFQFGSDANAFTDYEKTDYVLNLPSNEDEPVETALFILREVAGNLTFDPAAVERERGVILSEERMRASGDARSDQAFIAAAHPDELYAARNPIGLLDTIRTAPRQALVDYYQDFYRPDNAILVAVGDFDLNKLESRIQAEFSDWTPARPGPFRQGDYGVRRNSGVAAQVYAEKGLFESETATWFRPFITTPDNAKSRVAGMAKYLASLVLNTRFRHLADDPQAPYLSANLSYDNRHLDGNFTQLSVVPKPGQSGEALTSALKSLFQLKALGASAEEINEIVAQYDAQVINMVAASKTRFSDDIADEIMGDIDEDGVYQSAAQYAELWSRMKPQMTVDLVNSQAARLIEGDGPLLFRHGADAAEFTPESMMAAYHTAVESEPEAWTSAAVTAWPYSDFGPSVKPVDRQTVKALNYRHYVFPNGVTANVKSNRLVKNQIFVSVSFAGGYQLFSPQSAVSPMVTQLFDLSAGGLGKISREDMYRALSGKTFSVDYELESDHAALTGYTTPDSFETQMQVLMAFAQDPGYRDSAYANFRSSLGYMYSGLESSPGAAMSIGSTGFLAAGDKRYAMPDIKVAQAVSNADMTAIFRRSMSGVPVEVTISGDISDDTALKALERTFAHLAPVPNTFTPAPGGDKLHLPDDKTVQVYTHEGRADQAVAMVVFPTTDALSDLHATRGLTLLAAILSARLSDDLREEQGATYDIYAQSFSSNIFAGYGYIYVQCTLNPSQEQAFEDAVAMAVKDLRSNVITQDELDRAREPLLDGVNDHFKNNEDWVSTISGLYDHPELWDYRVALAGQFRDVTVADIHALAEKWLKPDAMLRMKAVPEDKP